VPGLSPNGLQRALWQPTPSLIADREHPTCLRSTWRLDHWRSVVTFGAPAISSDRRFGHGIPSGRRQLSVGALPSVRRSRSTGLKASVSRRAGVVSLSIRWRSRDTGEPNQVDDRSVFDHPLIVDEQRPSFSTVDHTKPVAVDV
jgi:hypothetical protein